MNDEQLLDSFLAPAPNDEKALDGFLKKSLAQESRETLAQVSAGQLDLSDDQIKKHVEIAKEGKGAWERAGEWTTNLLRPLNPMVGGPMAVRGVKHIGGQIVSGLAPIAPSFLPTGDAPTIEEGATPEVAAEESKLLSEQQQEIQAFPKKLAVGGARMLTETAAAAGGIVAEGAELLGGDTPENAAGLYKFRHDINKFITDLTGVSREDPVAGLGELAANAIIPIGVEAKVAPLMARASEAIVEGGTRVAGKTIAATAKVGKTVGPAVAAAEALHTGHPFIALGSLLAGYTPAKYGWAGSIKHMIMDKGLGGVQQFGKALSDAPYGVTVMKWTQDNLKSDVLKMEAKIADMRASSPGKLNRIDKRNPDGTPLYDIDDLSGVEKEIRLNQQKLDNAKLGVTQLDKYVKANRILSDAAKYGLSSVGNIGVTSATAAAFTSAGAAPGDEEAQRAGQELGMVFGLPGLHRANVTGRARMLRGEMIGKGKKLIGEDQLVGLTPEQKESVYAHAAEVAPLGGKIEIISPEEILKKTQKEGMPPEEGSVAPNGMFDKTTNTIFINRGAIESGVIGHEFGHLADQQLNLAREQFSKDIQGRIDSGSEAYQKFADNYAERMRKTRPDFENLTPEQINEEVKAEISRLIKAHMPPETFYGGKGGATIIKDGIGKLFNKDTGGIVGSVDGFGAPYTKGDLRALKDVFYEIGEKARSGEKFATSKEASSETTKAAESAPESPRPDGAVEALVGLGEKKKMAEARVDSAIEDLQKEGKDVTLEEVIRRATQKSVPKDLGDVSLMPADRGTNDPIDRPASKISDLIFPGTPRQAKIAAKKYGLDDLEISKTHQPGFVSEKGKWMSPEEARSTGEETRQLPESLKDVLTPEDLARERRFMPSDHPDAIESAAVRDYDGKIFTGLMHGDAMTNAMLAGSRVSSRGDVGYVTKTGRFLSRDEALEHARKIKQISKEEYDHSREFPDAYGKSNLESYGFRNDRRFMPSEESRPETVAAIQSARREYGREYELAARDYLTTENARSIERVGRPLSIGEQSVEVALFTKNFLKMADDRFKGITSLAADSPEQLRPGDVDRVMSDTPPESIESYRKWLLNHNLRDDTRPFVISWKPETKGLNDISFMPSDPEIVDRQSALDSERYTALGSSKLKQLLLDDAAGALKSELSGTAILDESGNRSLLQGLEVSRPEARTSGSESQAQSPGLLVREGLRYYAMHNPTGSLYTGRRGYSGEYSIIDKYTNSVVENIRPSEHGIAPDDWGGGDKYARSVVDEYNNKSSGELDRKSVDAQESESALREEEISNLEGELQDAYVDKDHRAARSILSAIKQLEAARSDSGLARPNARRGSLGDLEIIPPNKNNKLSVPKIDASAPSEPRPEKQSQEESKQPPNSSIEANVSSVARPDLSGVSIQRMEPSDALKGGGKAPTEAQRKWLESYARDGYVPSRNAANHSVTKKLIENGWLEWNGKEENGNASITERGREAMDFERTKRFMPSSPEGDLSKISLAKKEAGPNIDSLLWVHEYFALDKKAKLTPEETTRLDELHQQAEKEYGTYDNFYKAHGGKQYNAGNLFDDVKFMPSERVETANLSPERIEELKNDPNIVWHGSASGDLRGGRTGLHVGTHLAARQALEATIGTPKVGEWDGTRKYGETLLAGHGEKDNTTGYNASSALKEHYPAKGVEFPNGDVMSLDSKPSITPFRITGKMSNSKSRPHGDWQANGRMRGMIKRGKAKSGYYYENVSEDAGSISAVLSSWDHLEQVKFMPSAPEQYKEISSKHGLAYRGTMEDLHLFNDPKTNSTIAIKKDASPEDLNKKVLESRAKFAGEDKMSFMPSDYASHSIPATEKSLRDVLAEIQPLSKDEGFLRRIRNIESDLEMKQYRAGNATSRYAKSIIAHGELKGDIADKLLKAASDYDTAREISANAERATKEAASDEARLKELEGQHKNGTLSPYDATEFFNLKNPSRKIPDRFYHDGSGDIIDRLTGETIDSWAADPGDYSMSVPHDSPRELADAYNQENLSLPTSWTGPHPEAWVPELGVEKYPDSEKWGIVKNIERGNYGARKATHLEGEFASEAEAQKALDAGLKELYNSEDTSPVIQFQPSGDAGAISAPKQNLSNLIIAPQQDERQVIDEHSPAWREDQAKSSREAKEAGLPEFFSGREQLIDAIKRAHAAGYKFPHFAGENDPTGDRTVAIDIENLVKALDERAAEATGKKKASVEKELAYWRKQLAESMTAEQWAEQTGEPDPVIGMIEGGNIDVLSLPIVKNKGNSVSTVRSLSFGEDGKEVLVPTIIGGKVVSDKKAIEEYLVTGRHLGKFNSVEAANKYAKALHESEASRASKKKKKIKSLADLPEITDL